MISVCIATYNGGQFIKEQLDSILKQLTDEDEIIVSDDGSTDNTIPIISSYNDKRIKVYSHFKRPQKYIFSYTTANIKNALSHAIGDTIFLADQDDVWLPNKVNTMLKYCKEYDLVLADCSGVDTHLNLLYESHFKLYDAKIGIIHNFIGPCCYLGSNMCFKHSFLEKIKSIPDNVPHDLWIGIMANLKGSMYLLNERTMLYRRHNHNVSALNNKILKIATNRKGNIKKNNHTLGFKLKYRLDILFHLLKNFIC